MWQMSAFAPQGAMTSVIGDAGFARLLLMLVYCGICSRVEIVLLGMASVDSSAPETTSSDNSPTLVRRNFTGGSGGALAAGHHGGPGSDSGSSHSDSVESSSSGCKPVMQQTQQLRGALKAQQNDADKYVKRHFKSQLLGETALACCPLYLITNHLISMLFLDLFVLVFIMSNGWHLYTL